MRLFGKQHVVIYALSFFFLPGVVLHELSHLLVANLLLVPTGQIEFFPEIHGNQVKMGSVAIGRTDPLRRFVIGVAPVIGGLFIMLVASSYLLDVFGSWKSFLLLYVIFQTANTMFSSSKDMEGALGLLTAALLLGLFLQLAKLPIWSFAISLYNNSAVIDFFARINFFLLLALGLDVFSVLLFEGLMRLRR